MLTLSAPPDRSRGWTPPLLALVVGLMLEPMGWLLAAPMAWADEPDVGETARVETAELGSAQPEPSEASNSEIQPDTKPEASPWAATVELYGFIPWVDSTTTVRGFEANTNLDPGQVLNNLQSTFSARGSVEYNRLGLLTDIFYSQLGSADSRTGPDRLFTGSAGVTSITGLYDVALRYRFGEREAAIGKPGQYTLIPYAGLRVVNAQLGVSAQLRSNDPGMPANVVRQGSLDRTWVQPLIGTQASLFLSPRLRIFARGDVGGFGLSGQQDLSGNAQVGLGYALGNNTDLNVSWRYLGLAYNNGSNPDTGFSTNMNGVEVGLKLFF